MLRRLYIRDYVIVDMLELEFAPGFGALTGETGAGKSILVDALSLALGERADAASVRSGCDKAEISAEFAVTTGSPLAAWLRANDFDDDACLLRRVIEGERPLARLHQRRAGDAEPNARGRRFPCRHPWPACPSQPVARGRPA
jgi:DNA repair ATPase RecN